MRYLYLILLSLVLFGSCYREKTISDKDLENILHDMFLHNAYVDDNKIELDSLNMYEPIFKKYGYEVEDMLRTLTVFTRRKSSKFSDVLDKTADRLNVEYVKYKKQVDVLDTVQNIADRRFGKLIFQDSLINITRKDDTEALSLRLPAQAGRYIISYKYRFNADSIKKNYSVKAEFYGLDSLSKRQGIRSKWVSTSNFKDVIIEIETDETVDSLHGNYMWFPSHVKFAPVVIDSVRVKYFLPKEQALDSLLRSYVYYQFDIDKYLVVDTLSVDSMTLDTLNYDSISQDSISLPADTSGLVTQSDSLDR